MRIEWSLLALERILEIAEFRFPDDAARAQAWMGQVLDYAERLSRFPHMGSPVSSREEQPLRRLLFKDVWIVYEVREGGDAPYVLVLTVRHVREKSEDDL